MVSIASLPADGSDKEFSSPFWTHVADSPVNPRNLVPSHFKPVAGWKTLFKELGSSYRSPLATIPGMLLKFHVS
jgi:hypothetical protein